MSTLSRTVECLCLCCFVTTALSLKVLPPENVSLSWLNDLYPELHWTPPRRSVDRCSFQVNSTTWREGHKLTAFFNPTSSPWREERRIDGGFVNISIQTVCNGSMSEPVFTALNDPDLRLSCDIKSSTLIRCLWKPHSSANVHFFYNLLENSEEEEKEENEQEEKEEYNPPLKECPHYTDSMQTGCNLQLDYNQTRQINVLLNGTEGNRTIRNVYQLFVAELNLSLPPLNWTVKESTEQFHISWAPPEFSGFHWKYLINFTACTKSTIREISTGHSAELFRSPDCSYTISMRGIVEYNGGTEWTLDKHYDAVSSRKFTVLPFILVPLALAVLVILCLMWFMKHKAQMFPKIPQPNPELLKDILNNNKINTLDFHFPKAEEECCVSLVVDPKLIKTQV